MKKIFQGWLIVLVAFAFVLTVFLSYRIQTSQATSKAKELLKVNLSDATRQLERSQQNLKTIREMTENTALAKARALAYIIQQSPSVADNQEAIERVKKMLDVDEVVVTDGKVIVGANPDCYIGFDMSSNPQSADFLPALDNKDFYLVQKPRANAFNKILQYAGVARLDRPGIIQISYTPKRLLEAEEIADFGYIAENFRIGEKGTLEIKKLEEFQKEYLHNFNDDNEFYSQDEKEFHLYRKVGNTVLVGNLPVNEMYLSRNYVVVFTTIVYLVLFAVIFILVSILLQKVVIDSIYSVNNSLAKIKEGNLEEKVDVHNAIEFDHLSQGINTTVDALKEMKEREKHRIDADLKIGKDIQNSVIPTDFPVGKPYKLHAGMFTAREVGGDFYDFFRIDDKHLALLMADVSGKGITAALYMMTAKTLIKELVMTLNDPAEAMDMANRELVKNKSKVAFMFVTAFLAVYNTETGELVCVNAGHNPPLLKSGDNSWEYQRIKHSMALGVSVKAKFTNISLHLNKGDGFVLYTDGVTEAMNSSSELYGTERFRVFLNNQKMEPCEMVENLKKELDAYRGDFEQSDDITVLAFVA